MNTGIRIAALFAIGAFASGASIDDSTKMDLKTLGARAKAARTAAEHVEVARQYELRAEAFQAKAKEHEEEAKELAKRRNYDPMAAKWPAISKGPAERARSLAMQARRAAVEATQIAAQHRELAKTAPVA